ncbi:MAG: AI-2E family transporter [Gammaproteobacteria bacterium]|nr:MAG: AI-2E family transporter [Gammaproteobacteria bacterium]
MDASNHQNGRAPVKQAVEIAINLGLIFIVLAWGLLILRPFISLIIWGAVIAIASYTPFLKLQSAIGGSKKLAVMIVTLIGLGIVIVPTVVFTGSMVESTTSLGQHIADGTVEIPPPSDAVKDWPLIGQKVYSAWNEAAVNFTAFLQDNAEQVKAVGTTILSKVAGVGLGILQLVFSILIAAAFLSNAEAAAAAMQRFFRRLTGEHGSELLNLSVATIRSVAVGVLGIALIQATLAGIGMIAVGVPAAGLWALLVLIVAIAQLPPWVILGPIIFYVFSVESTTVAVIFMIWSVMVSFMDMVLKPIMLGRGVEAPMLVILLGAIGGMIMSGIIGLFVGAVVLAMGYKLFQAWLVIGEADADAEIASESGDSPDVQSLGVSE